MRVLLKSLRIWEVSIGLMYRFAVWKSERKEKWKDNEKGHITKQSLMYEIGIKRKW